MKIEHVAQWTILIYEKNLLEQVAIAGTGPQWLGSRAGPEILAAWMARAGFSAEPVRWFCGPLRGRVVEQAAR